MSGPAAAPGEEARDFFGARAAAYDDFIPRLVPGYHDGNALMLDLVPFADDAPIRVLDVGAGTGLIAALVAERFANAAVAVNDVSPAMLAAAGARFAALGRPLAAYPGAFPAAEIGADYDLVISSLALHHLAHADKRAGFAKLFAAMRPGAAILVRDVVAGATPALDRVYARLWRVWVQAHGHDDMSWFDEHLAEDNPARVEDQLAWLADCGFVELGCHWRHLNCALFGGRKPPVRDPA